MSDHDRPDEVDPAVDPPEKPAVADAVSERGAGESVRRALIRATLKPQEGVPPTPRQAPVFTMHQQPRGGAAAGRGNFRARNDRPDRPDGYFNKVDGNKVNGNRARPARRNERGGQQRFNSTSRSASSRRGKGRSR